MDKAHSGWNHRVRTRIRDGPVPPGVMAEAPHIGELGGSRAQTGHKVALHPFSMGSDNGVRKHSLRGGPWCPWSASWDLKPGASESRYLLRRPCSPPAAERASNKHR